MQELETLLTSLVQRGWKPYGNKALDIDIEDDTVIITPDNFFADDLEVNIRSIVSLES
jgi:hypothetical protein